MGDSIYDDIRSNGYNFTPIFDGKIHRFKPEGRSDLCGWFVGHSVYVNTREVQFLIYGDWSKDEKLEWSSKKKFTKAEISVKEKAMAKLRETLDKEREVLRAEARETANACIEKLLRAKSHPYLTKKQIGSDSGAYIDAEENLIIPIYSDFKKTIESYQKIKLDGTKRFLRHGQTKENLFFFEGDYDKILICEGFATGYSLWKSTGHMVVCAFYASNIYYVTKKTLSAFPGVPVILCADNDAFIDKNVGVISAQKVASDYGLEMVCPSFKDISTKPTDFNDLFILEGAEKVKRYIDKDERAYPTLESGFFHEVEVMTQNGPKINYKPDYIGCSEYFKNELNYTCNDSWTYRYKEEKYSPVDFLTFQKEIYELVNKKPTIDKPNKTAVSNFKDQVRAHCNFDSDDFLSMDKKINLKNGILDLETGRLLSHSSKYFFKYVLPYEYRIGAECPLFIEFLKYALEDDDVLVSTCAEIIGYTLLGGKPFLEKSFLLYGTTEGANGKSVFLDILTAIFGASNISTIVMSDLKDKNSMVRIDGKIANISRETPKAKQLNSGIFNAVVTGEPVDGKNLYQDSYSFEPTARMFFACNETPKFENIGGALRRIYPIAFDRTIPEEKRDSSLASKIISTELPGIFNFALEGLERLMDRGFLRQSKKTMRVLEQIKQENDIVYDYLVTKYYVTNDEKIARTQLQIKIKNLFSDFLQFASEQNQYQRVSSMTLGDFSKQVADYIRTQSGNAKSVDRSRDGVTSQYIIKKSNFVKNVTQNHGYVTENDA